MTIKVLVAEDDTILRAGLRTILSMTPDIEVIGEVGDGDSAVTAAETLKPNIVLMDIYMPPGCRGGLKATRIIAKGKNEHSVRIIAFTQYDEEAFDALRGGASGFLVKGGTPEELYKAIRIVASGEAILSPSVTRRLIEKFVQPKVPLIDIKGLVLPDGESSLTEKERQVIPLLARGLSNNEIAHELKILETTVKTHVRNTLGKLSLRDRVQVVIFAYERGLVEPGNRKLDESGMYIDPV